MPGPHPAVAATRVAVRPVLAETTPAGSSGEAPLVPPLVLVACSGGTDSLALAAAVAFESPRAGVRAGAIVVDHRLQDGSDQVAERAAVACREAGLDPVEVVTVDVRPGPEGPEAAARTARYGALQAAAARFGAVAVLLAHTRDDQAEQVLLGLARGSGARSLAGMPRARGLYRRPFLDLDRATTTAACRAQRLEPWQDPHNAEDRYARVRARRLLAAAEATLGPGLAAALARSADLLREDADALDGYAAIARDRLGPGPWPVEILLDHPRAVRSRLWRLLAAEAGCPPADVGLVHVRALDALLTDWRGQGPIHLPGGVLAVRRQGRVSLRRPGAD